MAEWLKGCVQAELIGEAGSSASQLALFAKLNKINLHLYTTDTPSGNYDLRMMKNVGKPLIMLAHHGHAYLGITSNQPGRNTCM